VTPAFMQKAYNLVNSDVPNAESTLHKT